MSRHSILQPEDIKVGAFIWYSGETVMSGWDCPAVITKVDKRRKLFWVKSLDDGLDQSQSYDFDVNSNSASSRKNMRLSDAEEVGAYMRQRLKRIRENVADAERQAKKLAAEGNKYEALLAQLLPVPA